MRYERPAALEEALELLRDPAARPHRRRHRPAGPGRARDRRPGALVDLQAAGLDGIARDGDGLRIGATTTLAELAATTLLAPYAAVRGRRGLGRLAAAAQRRHRRRQPLPAHALLVLPRASSGTAGSAAATPATRRSATTASTTSQPGDCISAHPSDLAPALAACGAIGARRGPDGVRELPLLELYRRPTEDEPVAARRSRRASSSTAVRLPAPPAASAYERAGERQAFSFALVGVAAARGGDGRAPGRGGVANVPRRARPGTTRSPACPATRRAPGSATCSRRSSNAPGRPSHDRHHRPRGRRRVPLRLAQAVRGVVGPPARGARARRRARRRPTRRGRR